MREPPSEPTRLRDLPPEEDLVGASELVREAAAPADIAPESRQRIRGRLRGNLAAAAERSPRRLLRLRPALVVLAALVSGSVGGAAVQSVIAERRLERRVEDGEREAAPDVGGGRGARRARRPAGDGVSTPLPPAALSPSEASSTAPPAEPAPAPPAEPVPSTEPAAAPAATEPAAAPAARVPAARRREPGEPGELAMAAPPSRAVAASHPATEPEPWPTGAPVAPRPETALLAEAIRKLRTDGDPGTALALLDERRAQFPDGALGPEAAAVRIEALLRSGRTEAALAELDRLSLDGVPGRDGWRVVRGELRALARRWREAEADFTAALAGRLGGDSGELGERALWGRAVARARLGDGAGARADYARYLTRFPDGRFAAEARRAAPERREQPGAP